MALLHIGCGDQAAGAGEQPEDIGTLQAALTNLAPTNGVGSIEYFITNVQPDAGFDFCNTNSPIATKTVPLDTRPLPTSLLPDGSGNMHPFGDALFALAPGQYVVCSVPLNLSGGPSSQCAPDFRRVTIVARQTTEVVLVSQCSGPDNGALDAITILNNPPVINDVTVTPSKIDTTCEPVTLTVTATDPDGDSLTYAWAVLPSFVTVGTGPTFVFRPPGNGTFEVRVNISDGQFSANAITGRALVSVPIHVSGCQDASVP
jgi:hypothetical protein